MKISLLLLWVNKDFLYIYVGEYFQGKIYIYVYFYCTLQYTLFFLNKKTYFILCVIYTQIM